MLLPIVVFFFFFFVFFFFFFFFFFCVSFFVLNTTNSFSYSYSYSYSYSSSYSSMLLFTSDVRESALSNVPFFNSATATFLSEVVVHLRPFMYNAGDIVSR